MISSKQVLVTGGQFIQQHYHGHISVGNKTPIDILTDAVATSALHDSGASFDKPKCHPRTRVKILEDIIRWNVGEDEDAHAGKQFLWLNGAAGSGKSAIAQSTIESCIERGLPLASFFFSKSDSTRNHAGSLVATLAYQLYCAFPGTEVQTEILSTIQQDPLIFKKTLQQQFTSLIIRPLITHFSKGQSTQHCVPFLIVLDGLDECTDRNAQKAILIGLAESVHNSNLRILIFVASRPEHDIKLSFSSKYLKNMHTALSLDLENRRDSDSDIRLYLLDRFAEIKDGFDGRTTGNKLAQDWPGDRVIKTLVQKSSGQFIYAATVIRYVESTRHRPDHRLDVVLDLRPVHGDHPFAELDELYATILKSALDMKKVLHVLSLHLMVIASIPCSVIEKLLSFDAGEVETLFSDMGALVQFSTEPFYSLRDLAYDPERSPLYLRMLHASFREYLLDAARSKQFQINMDYEIMRYVTHALQYLASCCSGSFDPTSHAGIPIYVLEHCQYCMGRRIMGRVTMSPELRQSVFSFPLKDFLEPHTSALTYPYLLQFFVTPFLKLLETIVLKDPTLSYIQDLQLGILRAVLMQQIQQYFCNDRLASVLVLFYHLGSHRFVPILKSPRYSYSHSTPFYPVPNFDEGDILSLSRIWMDSSFFLGDNVYHRYVRQLLRDPGRTAEDALGPVMYERAALALFKELAKTVPLPPSTFRKNINIVPVTDDEEDDAYPNLIFKSRKRRQFWQLKYFGELMLDDEGLYFLLLGYLIFLLPRCVNSEALVAACEEYKMSYMDQQDGRFPVRRRLLHEEINKYLGRVHKTNACITQ
ncbi:hypothetical protein CPC08DRAFT_713949 [Agrocybe pediades]|nr:hypothetical protein CPC08DRAFT_713949 [Agrocybe pediades]